MAVGQAATCGRDAPASDKIRNKYNTLTPAEIKKITKTLFQGSSPTSSQNPQQPPSASPASNQYHANLYGTLRHAPVRTASVLHKPRPPPIVVTDLDTTIDPCKNSPVSRSASKASLSASTYKVFQSPLANIKRLFRNMPRAFAGTAATETTATTSTNNQRDRGLVDELESKLAAHFETRSINFTSWGSASQQQQPQQQPQQQQNCWDQSLGHLSISDTISQLSLNKSQSPPVCPPPPNKLKSMCYMESAINYSNYDEFTRTRNERMAQRQLALEEGLSAANSRQRQQQRQQQQLANYDQGQYGAANDCDAWQLTSLPVHYERNLATLFEEKQQQAYGEPTSDTLQIHANGASNQDAGQQQHLLRPPMQFDDSSDVTLTNDDLDKMVNQRKFSTGGSMLSLNSCTTHSSNQTNQQQQQQLVRTPAKPYRFSFAQPLQPPHEPCVIDDVSFHKNLGLPPRMPAIGNSNSNNNHNDSTTTTDRKLSINTSETTTATTRPAPHSVGRRDNSSSGNSSNCSSQLNGINNCDRPNSTDASDKSSYNSNEDSNSLSASGATHALSGAFVGYGNLHGLADNEADVTLLSETSTLRGCSDASNIGYYADKCSELERTVVTLKNKLVSKEKELTDLQLNQLNNDYTIERLKKRLSQLERENAQLKANKS